MSRYWWVGWVIAVALVAWVWIAYMERSDALDRADELAAALPAIAAQRDSAQWLADALTIAAERADSVAQAARDTAAAVELRSRTRVRVVTDTLEVLVTDTTARRLMTEKDSVWEFMLAGRDSVIVAQDSAIVYWRASSFAKDTVLQLWQRQDSVRSAVNDALRSAIARDRRNRWIERGAWAACILWCPRP